MVPPRQRRAVTGSILSPEDERALMERVQAGDPAALDEVLRRYWAGLVAYLHPFAGSRDRAEDLAQESFLRFWNRRKRWKPSRSLRAFLYRIGRNLALNAQRRQRRRLSLSEAGSFSGPMADSPLERAQASELTRAVRKAIEALPPRRREIFELARFHDFTYAEIAAALEISSQTVANQMSAALRTLRDELQPFMDHGDPAPLTLERRGTAQI